MPNGAAAKAGLNKSILDTSQICSGRGQIRKKESAERWHSCECGTELDRDHNAAINILRLGSSQCGATYVEAPCLQAWGTSYSAYRVFHALGHVCMLHIVAVPGEADTPFAIYYDQAACAGSFGSEKGNCCCVCFASTRRRRSACGAASATSWSMSSRTPTTRSSS